MAAADDNSIKGYVFYKRECATVLWNCKKEQIAYEKERQSKLQDYRALVRESGYQTRTSPKDLLEDDPNEQTPGDSITKPYVIKPEEFDTLDNYDAVCYTYYADGVLVDEDEDPLEIPEIATSIGLDFASHFGDYDKDSIHIRNDLRHIDYEIVRDLRKYGDFHESEWADWRLLWVDVSARISKPKWYFISETLYISE